MKLCKDCAHFRPKRGERSPFDLCGRVDVLSPVDGRPDRLAELERGYHDALTCGPTGKFWQPQSGHKSDCAIYRAPAFEPGQCDCGGRGLWFRLRLWINSIRGE